MKDGEIFRCRIGTARRHIICANARQRAIFPKGAKRSEKVTQVLQRIRVKVKVRFRFRVRVIWRRAVHL